MESSRRTVLLGNATASAPPMAGVSRGGGGLHGGLVLAEAVQEMGTCGVPMLRSLYAYGLWQVTSLGMEALASALIHNCPHLTRLALHEDSGSNNDSTRVMVEEIALTAGVGHRLNVRGWEPGEE